MPHSSSGLDVQPTAREDARSAREAKAVPTWQATMPANDIVVARSALEAANIRFTESEVHLVLLENKPGMLATVTGRLGDGGVNLEALYIAGLADDLVELAIVSDNPKKAKKILEEF